MKKSILIIMLAAVTFSATAQDTLMLAGPKANYHYNYNEWPMNAGDTINTIGIRGNMAFYRQADDSLRIYGISASLRPSYDEGFLDTSIEKLTAVLRLYKRMPTNAVYQIGEDLTVMVADPPSFQVKMNVVLEQGYLNYMQYPVYPVYERYFENPVTVTDSFYIGFDQDMTHAVNFLTRDITLNQFKPNYHSGYFNIPIMHYIGTFWQGDTNGANFSFHRIHFAYPYIFPILTPVPDTSVIASDTLIIQGDTTVVRDTLLVGGDTIVVGGDTVVYFDTIVHYDTIIQYDTLIVSDTIAMGDTLIVCDTTIIGGDTIVNYDTILTVGQADLLQRLTGVMPNPAAEKARVVSSFGMSMVKVYNASGALVHTQRADGLYVDLDVSRWPAGTYLVRIHTPQGVAVKKLVVSR